MTSARCAASHRNRPFLAAERIPLTLRVTTRKLISAIGGAGAAMSRGPFRGLVEEFLDLGDLRGLQVGVLRDHREHGPPGGEMVQAHADVAEDLLRLGEDVVVEVDE